MEGAEAVAAAQAALGDREILIADGHHRYETALAYRDEQRERDGDPAGDQPYDFVLMYLANLHGEGLAIYPTHRVVMARREVDRRFLAAFDVRELPAGTSPAQVESQLNAIDPATVAFALWRGSDQPALIAQVKDTSTVMMAMPGAPKALRAIDAAVLEALVLAPLLGLDGDQFLTTDQVQIRARPGDGHGPGRFGRGRQRLPAARAHRRAGAGGGGGGSPDAAEVDLLLPQARDRLPAESARRRVTDRGWLEFCQTIAADVRGLLLRLPTRDDREPVIGQGKGGDDTTAIDDGAERLAVTRLEQLADRGISFRLVSEELGERRFGDDESPWVVVVDPIDGSLNAKRCLPFYCISIAFADGPTVDDVRFGYVLDLGSGEEWVATAGEGATVNGRPLGGVRPKPRLGIVDFEATNAALIADASARLDGHVGRIRVLGALALALCQLADGRLDGVASLKPSRSVDIAAAALIVREAGAHIDTRGPAAMPLDLSTRAHVVAARDQPMADRLSALLWG